MNFDITYLYELNELNELNVLHQFYVFQVMQQINLLLYDHFISNTTHSIIAAIGMKRFSDLDIMTYICARYRISGNTTDKFICYI